jgi:hypothetical protein
MRTIIVLAIGIYIGRQLYKSFDKGKYQASIKPALLKVLQTYGVTREEAEQQIQKILS